MSDDATGITRRSALVAMGVWGTAATVGATPAGDSATSATPERARDGFRRELNARVEQTPVVDTHEHLPDEADRLQGAWIPCDDWSALFSQYMDSDLAAARMPGADLDRFFSRDVDPVAKWRLLAPYWPAVKNTGYGRAIRMSISTLYGVDELNEDTITRVQAGYETVRKPGFYQKILVDMAHLDSCQVDSIHSFHESRHPLLLMQDINVGGMYMGPNIEGYARRAEKEVRSLGDWHDVIRWWFEKYGPYAVATKSNIAYRRGLDYEPRSAEEAEPVFQRIVEKAPVTPEQEKLLQDHLFWFVVEQATQCGLPVKLHTGYYCGNDYMPMERIAANPAQVAALCRQSPDTQWVFMHIGYPHWQDMTALAKHYRNAHLDMCWAWIIDPVSSTQFLKSFLLTAPSNKVFVFGGDYMPVECVLGHAQMARQGVARALGDLVEDGYLSRDDALELVEPLLCGNARRLFHVEAKMKKLAQAPWA